MHRVSAALADADRDDDSLSLALRIVDAPESETLNRRYRGKEGPTNVLSFPAHLPESIVSELPERPLGDLVICAPLVASEAAEQGKRLDDHWAHLCVHGVLHLLGHDHEDAEEAAAMEALETTILGELGVPDPYA
ncbi:MAG: rRNA maturation RNase YbeY [Gammaproteobacteria bacterium]